ncbi:MAG: YggU family protein [Syntrophobacteraceae bacterium CG23_combo_of_CG06-09_8_20_14_all_50_8]|nr:MAG: YggU family protein [Syntrophobacteraceae bacterium CG23_combo_of_CG06-09_8_20_14_all_50_8]
MISIKETADGVIFTIQVLPRSSKCEVVGVQGDYLKIKIIAPPVDGRANEECLRFLADVLGVKKAQVSIVGGLKSRKKTVAIRGLKKEDVGAIIPLS